jgi:Shedu protein SduA, C-terminal
MEISQLLSQLEEPKLLMLFRHLIDDDVRFRFDRLRAVPLDLPDAEVHAKMHLKIGSMQSNCALWFFQLSHVPAYLWDDHSAAQLMRMRMRQAFECLKTRPDLVKIFRRESEPDGLFRGALPEDYCSPMYGPDYYYFSNYTHDISDAAMEAFSRESHQLFTEIVGVPAEPHVRFGIGTPETCGQFAATEVRQFLVDLLNLPSSYYFVAREGRIEVSAVAEHGVFLVPTADTNGARSQSCAVATSTLREHAPVGLSDLNTLLNHSRTTERDLQSFFENHPHFLLSLDHRYCDIRPHICLSDGTGNQLVPDFMVRVENSDLWDIIELKKPQHRITIRSRGVERASAAAARGISELLQYSTTVSAAASRSRLKTQLGMAPYDPSLVLVIGRGHPNHSLSWVGSRAGFPGVRVVSYDYLFERARRCRGVIKAEASP